jgi:hypothetical protein
MADKIQLEIAIDPDGNVRFETKGLKGESCLAETESLERALGEVASRAKTSDYYAGGTQSGVRSGSGAGKRR